MTLSSGPSPKVRSPMTVPRLVKMKGRERITMVTAYDFPGRRVFVHGKEMVERLTNLIAIFENKALEMAAKTWTGITRARSPEARSTPTSWPICPS